MKETCTTVCVIGKALNTILECPIAICCQYHLPWPGTEPLMPTELLRKLPLVKSLFEWIFIHCPLCFIEISTLSIASSPQVIVHLKGISFAMGSCRPYSYILSDKGPQYSLDQFTTFSQQYGFTHIMSSLKNYGDMYLALLAYRSQMVIAHPNF